MGVEVNCGHSPRPSSPSPESAPASPDLDTSCRFLFQASSCDDGFSGNKICSKPTKSTMVVTRGEQRAPTPPAPSPPPSRPGASGATTSARLAKKIPMAAVIPFSGYRQTKEKLKTTAADRNADTKKKGPLIAKHPSSLQLNIDSAIAGNGPTDFAAKERNPRACRTPSPGKRRTSPLPSFTPLRRCRSNVSPLRRRSPSTTRSRPNSPAYSVGRGSSPAGSMDNIYMESVRKLIQKTQKARLYLLQQCGPHSFAVGGDSPDHKFKTIIGPQTCTCGRGPHCIHLLFVMLRVFQISDNDPRLWSKQLKNFEVESLFGKYEKQRQSRIKIVASSSLPSSKHDDETHLKPPSTKYESGIKNSDDTDGSQSLLDEGEKCCICQLDMVDGESLVTCSVCRHNHHHHCISVWAEFRRRDNLPFMCPLCRAPWDEQAEKISDRFDLPPRQAFDVGTGNRSLAPLPAANELVSVEAASVVNSNVAPAVVRTSAFNNARRPSLADRPPSPSPVSDRPAQTEKRPSLNSGASGHFDMTALAASLVHSTSRPLCSLRPSGPTIHLPRCHFVIPKEHLKTANAWTEVYGSNLVGCLYSRDWRVRETALRRLSQELSEELAYRNGCRMGGGSGGGDTGEDFIRCCCQILALVAADPVYRVYLSCLQCLRTLLAHVPVRSESDLVTLQERVRPIIATILLRSCDGSKRASMLSVSTLVELCKGQSGELAVGNNTLFPGFSGIGGIGFILKSIMDPSPADQEPPSWQWILGRLNVLEQLMLEFPEEFQLVLVPPGQPIRVPISPSTVDLWDAPIASRLERLITTLDFVTGALDVRHATVGKQAREVFMAGAQFAARLPAVLDRVCRMASRDSLLELRLNAWIRDDLKSFLTILSASASRPSPPAATNKRQSLEVTVSAGDIARRNLLSNQNFGGDHHRHHRLPNSPTHRPLAVQPHLPSCGGISPASKVLDRGALLDAFSAGRRRAAGRQQASPLRPTVPAFPLPPSSHVYRSEQSPHHVRSAPRSLENRSPSVAGRRPTFLPLRGSFRDVLEWERKAPDKLPPFLPSVSSNHHSSNNINHSSGRHRSPPRPGRHRAADLNPHIGGSSLSAPSTPSCAAVIVPVVPPPSVGGGSPGRKGLLPANCFSNRPLRVCACGREVSSPNLRSPRKQRPLGRVFSKKAGGMLLGPLLPSKRQVPSAVTKASTMSPLHSRAPPSTPEDLAVLLDNTVCKQKKSVELEEAVTLAKTMSAFVQEDLPFIPGLMQYDDEQELVIHVEPDNVDNNNIEKLASCPYYETVHWRRGSILGKGAFSNCYQARDVRSGMLMAVKQVTFSRCSPDHLEKVTAGIKEEITLMARLDHPHVVRMLGATQQQDHFNMFVEWMAGGSVSCLLEKYGAFTETVIINYTRQVLSGLAYLHDHQILHRDLKGANLLVDSTGQHLRIADFGAAARLASHSTVAGEFQGQVLGTIAFMAPEVLRGEDYGRSCDIWSVGCILFEMATGKPPWDADDLSNHYALMYKIACSQESPRIPEHLSPVVRDLSLRCLELKSEYRPPARDLLKHPVFHL